MNGNSKKKIRTKKKAGPLANSPDQLGLSRMLEEALSEVSEKIFTRLHDDGLIADCIYMDSNMGTDVLNAIEDEMRKCIRG